MIKAHIGQRIDEDSARAGTKDGDEDQAEGDGWNDGHMNTKAPIVSKMGQR